MWINVKDAAVILGIKEKTIYHFVTRGLIPHYRIGKLLRFDKTELEGWMTSKKAGSIKTTVDKIVRSAYTLSRETRPPQKGGG